MTEPVTVLGLGPMGHAIADAFVAAGHQTTVWNRSTTRPTPDGAVRADLTAAVAASKIVVVCVLDYDAVRAVLDPIAATLRGRLVVNVTSGSPDAARATAEWAAGHGIDYVEGAIMTPTNTIGTADAVLLLSGTVETDALSALGGTQTYLGTDPGRAAAYDVALLDIFWTSVVGVAHAFALARSENITPSELAPLARGIATLMPIVIDEHGARLEEGRHGGDYSNLRSAAAGMAHIIHTARARGIDAGVMEAAHALTQGVIDAGHGDDGISRLTVALESA